MISFFFKTYGCQANVADSEGIAKFLKELGCSEVPQEEQADLIIVNTCAVRDKAEQKLFSYLGVLGDIKRHKRHLIIGVIGCVASYKKKELYDRFDQINFVYGAREDLKNLCAYLADMVTQLQTTQQLYETEQMASGEYDFRRPVGKGQDRDIASFVKKEGLLEKMPITPVQMRAQNGGEENVLPALKVPQQPKELHRSFINIMTGCNKCCAYCIVPFTRGKEVSYDMQTIVDRVRHDVTLGAKEITLIGQNVNSYRCPAGQGDFSQLLRRVCSLEGEFWVRWVSPHPQDMTVELFDVLKEYQEKVVPYVHFPVQAGSNRILSLMKRNYSIELYLEQIGWLRDRLPHVTISTDIIVGFPGETVDEYLQTRHLIETVRYDWIYSFVYSPRKFTRATTMSDDCPAEEKSRRLQDLQEVQLGISLACNQRHVNKKMKTLVEKRLIDGKLLARTEGNIRITFDGGDDLIGTFVDLYVESAGPALLHGRLAITAVNCERQVTVS